MLRRLRTRIVVATRPATLPALKWMNQLIRGLAARSHHVQHAIEWKFHPPPEWYDHFLDVYWQWEATGNPLFAERGVFAALAVEPGATVLDICCGDGFSAKHFLAQRAASVLAVDFDPVAIEHARRYNFGPKVRFELCDIRHGLPAGSFDNIAWDAAIEHFTQDEIVTILTAIKTSLRPGGVLSGYTLVARRDGGKHLPHHEREFLSKHDLLETLHRHFPHVVVFETVNPERTNLYFYASEAMSSIPFSGEHPRFATTADTGAEVEL
jgi:SAM-dependent methyltransferase